MVKPESSERGRTVCQRPGHFQVFAEPATSRRPQVLADRSNIFPPFTRTPGTSRDSSLLGWVLLHKLEPWVLVTELCPCFLVLASVFPSVIRVTDNVSSLGLSKAVLGRGWQLSAGPWSFLSLLRLESNRGRDNLEVSLETLCPPPSKGINGQQV